MADTTELDDLLAQLDSKPERSSRIASVQVTPSTRLPISENQKAPSTLPSYRLSSAASVSVEDLSPQPPARTANSPLLQRAVFEKIDDKPSGSAHAGKMGGDVDEIDMIINGMAATYDTKDLAPVAGYCANGCKGVIPAKENYFEAMGYKYHGRCWLCAFCRKQLGSGTYYERKGSIYCDSCYRNNILPKCFRCGDPIANGELVNADGKKYHPNCFACPVCSKTLLNYLFRDGHPFCEQHYYERYNPKCHVCHQALKETTVTALGREWHPNCFTCERCNKSIGVGSFYSHHGRPVCPSCYERVASQQVSV